VTSVLLAELSHCHLHSPRKNFHLPIQRHKARRPPAATSEKGATLIDAAPVTEAEAAAAEEEASDAGEDAVAEAEAPC
jgi:hypothetical protein